MKLFKYSCGCIGTEPDKDNAVLVFDACDKQSWDDHQYGVFIRNGMSQRDRTEVIGDLRELIADGYAFRQIRSLLGARS